MPAEPKPKISAAEKRSRKIARRRGELFAGDPQVNLFAKDGKPGVEYLDPARPRPELEKPADAP